MSLGAGLGRLAGRAFRIGHLGEPLAGSGVLEALSYVGPAAAA